MIPSGRGLAAAISMAATAALTLGTAAPAGATAEQYLTPHTHFTMAPDGSSGTTSTGAQIPNIDSVKSTIRNYYGAVSGIANKESSPYIDELASIQDAQWAPLLDAYEESVAAGHQPAIVFDADDTTLWTYDMEDAAMHFNFDPALQDVWVQDQRFPATPGMVKFVNRAERLGFAIFGLTGRNDNQKAATLANLDKVGYQPFTTENFFTKWTGQGASTQPSYVTCAAAKCTTVEYKAQTRKHIEEDLGYDIVLNVGDQWSDLQGGYADRTLKLPNPTYYLPSPDLDGTPADAEFSPRTEFTMAPDGSSGATEGGEGIPNIDSVKSTIRTYYGAVNGISNKENSPYISELDAFTTTWAQRVTNRCTKAKAQGDKPAIVLDADDTTLWTYDMEDAEMKFNFDPALQDVWVQDQRFPATPHMDRVVTAAQDAGCKIVGLTGRRDFQRDATIANLNTLYDGAFKEKFYFTKWNSDAEPPAYVTCVDRAKCTTIEYKSSTRRHVQQDLGLRIVANFGDQFSDLLGGYADKAVKLPNPTYYLP